MRKQPSSSLCSTFAWRVSDSTTSVVPLSPLLRMKKGAHNRPSLAESVYYIYKTISDDSTDTLGTVRLPNIIHTGALGGPKSTLTVETQLAVGASCHAVTVFGHSFDLKQ